MSESVSVRLIPISLIKQVLESAPPPSTAKPPSTPLITKLIISTKQNNYNRHLVEKLLLSSKPLTSNYLIENSCTFRGIKREIVEIYQDHIKSNTTLGKHIKLEKITPE